MNHLLIQIIGRITSEVEMSYTKGGKPYTKFSVAYNKQWTDNTGKKQEKATFFRVTVFNRGENGKQAENAAQYLEKGQEVMVITDTIEAGAWVNKDGDPMGSLEVIANDLKYGAKAKAKNGTDAESVAERVTARVGEAEPIRDEDIPF